MANAVRTMTSTRKTALVAGIFYLLTFVSIPTLGLYNTLKTDQNFVTLAGSSTSVLWGCVLEIVVALAGIGTAVTLYPVVRRQNESMALGFVATRTLEAAMIFLGVVSLLSLVTLRNDFSAASDHTGLIATGESLVGIYKGTFVVGQTLMPAMNAFLLGTLLYQSRLVPRILPVLGLIGAPLLTVSTLAIVLGHNEIGSPWSALSTLPIAVWEFGLGLWLTFKGFRPSPITEAMDAEARRSAAGLPV
ncbi:MAG: DUF4386 domain-containing protein [Candidatus Nanopelagicales bacterium]